MEPSQPSSSLSSLLCPEDRSCLNEDELNISSNPSSLPSSSQIIIPCSELEYEDDYIKLLLQNEIASKFGSNFSPWLRDARLNAINWVLNTQTLLGFCQRTAYLSLTYFDRFLSVRIIDEGKLWAIRLLSVACLSLAAKMEECKIPALSEYRSDVEDYCFDCQVIQKMEILVLSTLEWKMGLITPFAYLHYFINKLGDQGSKLDDLLSRAMELLIAALKEINTVDHRPSMIAAAAVLSATNWQLTQEALKQKISIVSLWEASENLEEQLFSCYSLMQRLSPNYGNLNTPNLSEVGQQTLCATTSVVGTKRRLTFKDDHFDKNPDSPEKKISRR